MDTKTSKASGKISVKIWNPIIEAFDKKIDMTCLRRDAFLDALLEIEIEYLDREIWVKNSRESYSYVSRKLEKLPRKLVSLALRPDLVLRLNEICRQKLIVRDAFFNRLFLLLSVSPKNIDVLLFDSSDGSWRDRVWQEYKHDEKFFQGGFYPLASAIDSFWAIRVGLEREAESGSEDYQAPLSGQTVRAVRELDGTFSPVDSIYTKIFEQKLQDDDLLGLSCYMPDRLIPASDAMEKYQISINELIAGMESL